MDSKSFDALTRGFGAQRNRREALKGLAAGLLGLGTVRGASAQVTIERQNCGQSCSVNGDCNAGMRCTTGSNKRCVRKPDGGGSCSRNDQCGNDTDLCRNGRCVNQSTCNQCEVAGDCPSGQACRNGRCGECTRDGQCGNREVCRNGRCERDRRQCRRNRDCPKRKRCRNGRCKRK